MPPAIALGLFYAALFVGGGASLPFMPLWFKAQGLSGPEIGVILAAPYFGRTLAGPALALWADGFRLRRTPMIWMGVGAAVAFAAVGFLHGFWGWLIAWLTGSILLGMLSPLADVIALRRSRRDGFAYGLPRGIGSAGYVFGNVVMGAVMLRAPVVSVLIWTIAAAALASLSARVLLPREPVHETGEIPARADLMRGLGGLLRDPVFMLAIGSTGLIQASHGFYYGFSTLLWRHQGVPENLIGLLWGAGVGTEVLFMWFLEPWRRRVGPARLLIVGGIAAVVRWTALALSPPALFLFPIQALHALTYAATFFASLRLIEQLSPPQSASAAQTLNSVFSGGLMMGAVTLASGPMFEAWGFKGYLAMTAIAGLGLIGAVILAGRLGRLGARGLTPHR
jgi:MFS transporter, PPP family, 3-phenylpropionic acid transporter